MAVELAPPVVFPLPADPDVPLGCDAGPEPVEVVVFPDDCGVTTLVSAGSVSGGSCDCTLQIQAMIWMPGLRTEFLSSVEEPNRENGPKEAAFARAATSLSDQAASITRFLTAINAVGMAANGPVFAGGPDA
jgi:hypothetical protein